MAPATLVNLDIEDGMRVIEALDAAGNAPQVALWAKLQDYENWRLVLASDRLDQESEFNAYTEINKAIDKAGIPIHRQPGLLLRKMKNPFIQALRSAFAATSDTYGMRLGGQTFGGKYLEEAFVYRIK